MPESITIRAANSRDSVGVCELLAQLGYPARVEEIPARLAAIESLPNALVLVAANRYGELIGLATCHIFPSMHDSDPVAWLTTLVVLEDARGAGIGSELVRHVEEWAAKKGAKRLSLTSGLHRKEAHSFYERRSYQNTGLRFTKNLVPGDQ